MTVLAAPLVIAAHVEHLPNLPGWGGVAVFDGAAVTRGDTREWVTVGYVPDADSSLSFEAVPTAQNTTTETGTVDCQLVVAADDIAAARARALGLIAAWSQWLVTDRTLRGSSGEARLLPGSSRAKWKSSSMAQRPKC